MIGLLLYLALGAVFTIATCVFEPPEPEDRIMILFYVAFWPFCLVVLFGVLMVASIERASRAIRKRIFR